MNGRFVRALLGVLTLVEVPLAELLTALERDSK
jgi:hypothetical protein